MHLSDSKSKASTKQLNFSDLEKRGDSDTPLYPVNTGVGKSKPCIQLEDDRIFVDYLKFFGKDLSLSSYHEQLLVELFLKGKFFAVREYPDRDKLEVSSFECNTQIHEGSTIRWSKSYQNSIGVVLKVAYPCEGDKSDSNKIIAICLEFSGTPLSQLIPRNNQLVICQIIDCILEFSRKIKVTRIDTTLEFSIEKLDLFEVRKAIDNGDVMGVGEYHYISGNTRKNLSKTFTAYFGGVKSDRLTRLYNTEKKHGYLGIRFEVQNRRKYADFVVSILLQLYKKIESKDLHGCNDINTNINNDINQFVVDYNLSRRNFVLTKKEDKKRWQNRWQVKEFEFWSKFKKSFKVTELRYQFAKEDLSIKKSVSHFARNFSGLLCGLYDNLGGKLFDSLIRAIIIAKKKGIGMGVYKGTESKYLQLAELASDGILGICDEYLLSIFHGIGLFKVPSHLPVKNKKTILKDDNLRLSPRLNLGLEF